MSKSRVYKIICNTTLKCYIGSTTEPLYKRLSKHKNSFNNYINGKVKTKCSIVSILENNNYSVILLEELDNCSKYELLLKELEWINNTENCINIKKDCKTHQRFKCECGGFYTLSNWSFHNKTQKHQKFLNFPNN